MKNNDLKIVLASASPRRAELLRALGLEFTVISPDIDERQVGLESPGEHALRLAEAKAEACSQMNSSSLIIGADTVVVIDGRFLGKPADKGEAGAMLRCLNGRTHEVITAVALKKGMITSDLCSTEVTFKTISESEIDWYLSTGEAMDKAGAYGIQGFASLFVSSINGSYSNVVGLPLHLLPILFARHGIDIQSLLKDG